MTYRGGLYGLGELYCRMITPFGYRAGFTIIGAAVPGATFADGSAPPRHCGR
jgi:hypothetical protein